MENIIHLKIRNGFRPQGVMHINLDELALRCGNREYRCCQGPNGADQGMQIPVSNFRKICKLILEYGDPEDIWKATEAFSKHEKAKGVWADEQTKFKARRTR